MISYANVSISPLNALLNSNRVPGFRQPPRDFA